MINNIKRKIILSGNTAWGMFNFRSSFLKHLVALGCDVYVAAPYDELFFPKIKDLGCKVLNLPVKAKGTNPLEDIWLVIRYCYLFMKIRPDVSLTYTIKPNIYGSIAARITKTRYLPITTGLGYVFLSQGLASYVAKKMYKLAFSKADYVLFLNKDDMNVFQSQHLLAEHKAMHLYGEGVDLDKFYYSPKSNQTTDKVVFLFIGRILYDKGLKEYVDAARCIKSKYKNVSFKILGAEWKNNPSSISHEQLLDWEQLGLIEYLGATDDVRPYIVESDCVVLPSYREGMPCTLMEAAAMGRPLIATDVPGCHEVVVNHENGLLCNVKDANSLAEKMEEFILMSHSERSDLGNNGRLLMERKFCIEKVLKQYNDILNIIWS